MAELLTDAPATVLAVYAHPDDPDVAAGGTLARWAAAGSKVDVCICADGDKGSLDPRTRPEELVALRREETSAAGRLLGVSKHHWLGFGDGELEDRGCDVLNMTDDDVEPENFGSIAAIAAYVARKTEGAR